MGCKCDLYGLANVPTTLYAQIKGLQAQINALEGQLGNTYTQAQVDALIADAISDALNSVVDDILPNTNWLAPTLINSWVNSGGGETEAAYTRDANGMVWIRGRIEGGVQNTVAFNLPEGYRPNETVRFPINAQSAAGQVTTRCTIFTSGNVNIGAITSPTWVSLGYLSFEGPIEISP
jgi:hypothetical protein